MRRKLSNVIMKNNVLINEGGGPAYQLDSQTASPFAAGNSDYNTFYSTGAVLIEFGGATYPNLTTYQNFGFPSARGLDQHSVSKRPKFVSDTAPYDLHLAGGSLQDVALIGTPVASVMEDIDGEIRGCYVSHYGHR